METREPSSNLEIFLFGKSPRVKGGYLGGQMVAVGMIFRLCHRAVSECYLSRSQSRMRGDFLWYEEQIEMSQEERDAKAARRWANCRCRYLYLLMLDLQGEESSRPFNPVCYPTTGPSGKNRRFHQTNLQYPRSTHIRVPQVAHCGIFFRA